VITRAGLEAGGGEEKKSLPLPRIEPRLSVTIPTELPLLRFTMAYWLSFREVLIGSSHIAVSRFVCVYVYTPVCNTLNEVTLDTFLLLKQSF
jgi:hypothetical protein